MEGRNEGREGGRDGRWGWGEWLVVCGGGGREGVNVAEGIGGCGWSIFSEGN
jgi:hypothetical protein